MAVAGGRLLQAAATALASAARGLSMAREWSPRGVTCNAIGPGFFPTELTRPVFENADLAAQNAAQTCVGRNGKLEDIHGCAIFLASNASAYITGQTVMILIGIVGSLLAALLRWVERLLFPWRREMV